MRRMTSVGQSVRVRPQSRIRPMASCAVALVLASASPVGCGIGDVASSIDKAVAVLDAAIMDLKRQSSEWQQILRRD